MRENYRNRLPEDRGCDGQDLRVYLRGTCLGHHTACVCSGYSACFEYALFGIEELLTFPTIWIYFLGGACASFTNSHIECGLVGAVAKNPKVVAVAKNIANICATGLSIYVLKWATEYAQYSFKVDKISAVLKIPMPIGECIILGGLALMALFTLARTIENLVSLKEILKNKGGIA